MTREQDIAQLHEALDWVDRRVFIEGESWNMEFGIPGDVILDAARELLTLKEAGALIITPDENGEWPEWAKHDEGDYWSGRLCSHFLYRDVLDALRDAKPDGDS